MAKNIFVLGLTEQQWGELMTVDGTEPLHFHGLLSVDRLAGQDYYDFNELLADARAQLREFHGSIDAIIAHWDFPTSVLGPILAADHDIPSPSLRSVLACEHKYWSRLIQQQSVPECVPGFAAFDPFDDDALATIDLTFPFWVKPIKSHSSQLGFKIDDAEQFGPAIEAIRDGIHRFGDAFDQALALVDLPEEIKPVTGSHCIAEQLISGSQAAPEGSMYRGEFIVHGMFDMHKTPDGNSYDRIDYPAANLPDEVQQRMIDITERYIRHVGFDNGCFNAEFMWDEDADTLWLVEVNTRISQSHSDLFAKVDGVSNHEFAIDIALGRRPRPEARAGPFGFAAQCRMLLRCGDGVVEAVPTQADIARVEERFPDTLVGTEVAVGDRLSELPNQSPYAYKLATLYMGAESPDALARNFDRASDMLPFNINT